MHRVRVCNLGLFLKTHNEMCTMYVYNSGKTNAGDDSFACVSRVYDSKSNFCAHSDFSLAWKIIECSACATVPRTAGRNASPRHTPQALLDQIPLRNIVHIRTISHTAGSAVGGIDRRVCRVERALQLDRLKVNPLTTEASHLFGRSYSVTGIKNKREQRQSTAPRIG